jgi:hypothetical protein
VGEVVTVNAEPVVPSLARSPRAVLCWLSRPASTRAFQTFSAMTELWIVEWRCPAE